MRLIYITRTDIGSTAAQANQIKSMAKAFGKHLGDNFILVAPGHDSGIFPFKWIQISSGTSQIDKIFKSCIAAVTIARENPDAVFYTRDIAIAFIMTAFLGKRSFYEAHKSPASHGASAIMRVLSIFRKFKLVSISAALTKFYQERFNISPRRILTAHDGVFLEDYDYLRSLDRISLREKLSLPLDKYLVVHTGSLYKGGTELFEYVARSEADGLLIIHIGGSKEDLARWRDYYCQLEIKNIRFLPHQPHERVREYQMAADSLFYMATRKSPIYWCTSPLKIFEYMATGIPIVAACIGSVSEILNKTNSFCFDPDLPETLVAAMNSLREHPEEARNRAMTALREVKNNYSWYKRARDIIEFSGEDNIR